MNYPVNRTPPAEFRQCFGCNYETVTAEIICPRCRRKQFFTSSSIRKRGIIVMLMGLLIAGLIGAVAVFVGILLLGSAHDPSSSRRVSGNQTMLFAIYCFFALLIGLGLHFVITGGWMLAFGKRNRILVWVMWVFLFLVLVAGGLITELT